MTRHTHSPIAARRWQARALSCVAAVTVSGCGASLEEGLPTGTLQLPEVSLPIPVGFGGPKGSSTEVYERVARGVLTCWLGANGPLRQTHLFHAVAEPARMGGLSEIVLHERVGGEERKRGAQAARIRIEPLGGTANVSFRNMRLPDEQADRFNTDVYRWAAGDEGCVPSGITEGWAAAATAGKSTAAGPASGAAKPVTPER